MILILCKYYNDLDQIVPLVWKLSSEGRKDIGILMLDAAYDMERDFRIRFLQQEFSIPVSYYHQQPGMAQMLSYLMMKIVHGQFGAGIMKMVIQLAGLFGRKVQAKVERKIHQFPRRISRRLFGKPYARRLLGRYAPSVIISDNRPRPIELYEAANEVGIPVVGIPHGLNSAVDIEIMTNERGRTFRHDVYTVLATQYENEKKRYIEQQTPAEKVHVLGSTHYCAEWHSVYGRIMPPAIIRDRQPGQRKLRVVFMDHVSKYSMNEDIILENVKAVLDLDFVLKPSTE